MKKYSSILIKEIFESPFAEKFIAALRDSNYVSSNVQLDINIAYLYIQNSAMKHSVKNGTKLDLRVINDVYCILITTEYQKGNVIIPEYIIKQYFEFKNSTIKSDINHLQNNK